MVEISSFAANLKWIESWREKLRTFFAGDTFHLRPMTERLTKKAKLLRVTSLACVDSLLLHKNWFSH